MTQPQEHEVRLQKAIADAGVTSRRKAEVLIQQGQVTVNGEIVRELGTKVTTHDHVEVGGVPLMKQRAVTYLFYKPRDVISAVSDDKGRPVVSDFFADKPERVYPIGRLDYDASGLLLVTNDGELANLLMHPKFNVDKTYLAKVEGIPDAAALKQLRQGVTIHGKTTAPAKASLKSSNQVKQTALVYLTIHEGMNHQVKLMLAKVGHPVQKLKRERYAFLDLTGMQPGETRRLNGSEVQQLYKMARQGLQR
ncbi:pseudouridine synthase [Lapidilactobacillus gannanensis]|jgi:23S rRNA pseudouridine2605 synthase|uniref:Pseudouridine synthase n=1 Tax=Lapidilactobacillus gannanensis TaxID=2486002 RepID=A0ABW4BRF0_9LACO|nr:pseudouridine synthase [Lapidilactobacillus gannanensis]MCH4057396.1 rRNA pseudouridine synthase [Lactobacillaceae bacterium]